MLKKRILGKTNLAVSIVGLGCVKFGRNENVKYPYYFQIPNDADLANFLALAQDLQINLLDTAPAYGQSEERLGKLLKNQRNNWIISTKVGEEFYNNQSQYIFTPKHTEFSIYRSLKYLKTNYLDIVLIHSNGKNEKDIILSTGVLDTLEKIKEKGDIRAIGFSGKTNEGHMIAIQTMDIIMTTFQEDSSEDIDIIERASNANIGILVKKALNSGHINKKYKNIKDILSAILKNQSIHSVILGTVNLEHLKENVQAAIACTV